jgi:hypothetical protein
MDGCEELAAAVVEREGGGVSLRTWVVVAVNAGPPKSLDLAQTAGGATVAAGVRYSATYHTLVPAVNDVVKVLVTTSSGSGRQGGRVRGGDAFVVDKIAV